MKISSMLPRLLFPIAVIGLFASSVMAENWPRFRGPNGQGISGEKGIPIKWSENNLVWKTELAGTGPSSPVIWNDKVFVTFADEEINQCILMAVDTSDGVVLWQKQYTLKPAEMNDLNSPAASTPAVDGDGVYAIWYGGDRTLVTAVDHDGKDKWKTNLGLARHTHGPAGSPIVYKDMVVFTLEQEENDENLQSCWYALDRRTGEIRWRLDRDSTKASSSTPCLYRSPTGQEWIIFASRAHGITAVDPDSGTVAWEEASAFPARVVSSPVLAGDLIINKCGQGGSGVQLAAVRPPAEGTAQPQLLYTLKERFVPYVPTSIAAGPWLFMFHDQGLVSCLDSRTGNVLWSEKPGGKFFGSPVLVEDRLYCITTTGQVVVLRAGDKYERLAVNDLGEPSHATPAIANGRMILRTISHLYCIAADEEQSRH